MQAIVREKIPFSPYPFLNVGQKVRVRGGSLDGICGVLSAINNDRSLIVSVDSIQRSLAIRIEVVMVLSRSSSRRYNYKIKIPSLPSGRAY